MLERVCEPRRLLEAWQQVKRNAGAAGIDRMTVEGFESSKEELFPIIRRKLEAGEYRFKPARRVLIPKAGAKGKFRKLGIPVVMDRIVGASIALVFEEIFDAEFTESNFGFRRGKSQHQAIEHVRGIVEEGFGWCASVDLKSFFDEIPHDLILRLIRRKIADERLVRLVARALKAGVIVEGKFEKTTKGSPQGSPLSPMLSNIVLNEMDYELERRGLKYCRWADDFVILVRSERAASRVMENITRYLEEELRLPVNREKSEVTLVRNVEFLAFQILANKVRVSEKSREKFKEKVRELTRRNNGWAMHQVIERLNLYLRGWGEYFRVQQFKKLFGELDGWIRSRLRSMQLKKWKNPRKFQRIMIAAGYASDRAHRTWVRMNRWQSVARTEVRFVLNRKWFDRIGLISLQEVAPPTLTPKGVVADRRAAYLAGPSRSVGRG
ncbi:MAG TPA: group II intron reverse transcriptase/maturase [Candidatus Paceibacterota bacterium]|nr:group II intron reverse transcriptase/maturase [Candidatus Paceibacterota bacterium]